MKMLEIRYILFKMNWSIIKYGKLEIIGRHALFNKFMNKLKNSKINQNLKSILLFIKSFIE